MMLVSKVTLLVLVALLELCTLASSCFTGSIHPPQFSAPTRHIAVVGDEILLAGPSSTVDLLHPVRNSSRLLHYHSRYETREDATFVTHRQWLFVAGGFSYDDDESSIGETMDVLDVEQGVAWSVSFNHTLPHGSRAVAAANTVLFYHQRSPIILSYDLVTKETGMIERTIAYQGAAAYEDAIYFVERNSIATYDTVRGTWRNTTLRAAIRFGINMVFAAKIGHSVSVFVVTYRDIIKVNPTEGTFSAVTKIGPASAGLVHNDTLILLHGPSSRTVNSILFYNFALNLQYSWQYDNYNFRFSSMAVLNNTLYIANWRPNANFDSGRQLLVYNMEQSHHELTPLQSADYVIQHGDYLVAGRFNTLQPHVVRYNLATNVQTQPRAITATRRQNIKGLSAGDYVIFYGGELIDSTVLPLELYVISIATTEWYNTAVPTSYNRDLVGVLGNALFFVEDTEPIIHMFNASNNMWSKPQELKSKTVPDMVLKTADCIIFLSTIRLTSAFDMYCVKSSMWTTLQLHVASRLHGAALIDDHLFVAGGIDANEALLSSFIKLSLHSDERATFNMTQPRALPAIKWHRDLIAVIGGVMNDRLHLSTVIDVFRSNGAWIDSLTLQQPERLGLNFGHTISGPWMYLRYNSNVYQLALGNKKVERLLVPIMAGSFIRAVGNYLVMYGDFNDRQEFYFYDTSTPTSLHLSTNTAKVLFWKNFVILYLNGLMKIELPTIDKVEGPSTVYESQPACWIQHTSGRNLTYLWEVRNHNRSQLLHSDKASTLRLHANLLPVGQHWVTFTVRDRCGLTTQSTTNLELLSKPTISLPQNKSYSCRNLNSTTIRVWASRTDNTIFNWTRNGEQLPTTGDTLSLEGFQCAVLYNVCVIATNPAGSTTDCTTVIIHAFEFILPPIAFAIIVTSLVVLLVVRKRFSKVKQQELELKSMLNAAKRDIIDKKAGKIISSTSWEWIPDESYSYCSPNQLPVLIDTTQLGFDKKHGPLDINVWFQGTILVSSKKKAKTSRLSFLHQSLLDDEEQFDVYAPKSPKFEVNIDPSSFSLGDGRTVMLTVWVKLKITTKADIQLVIVSEKTKTYSSLAFKAVGKPSPWIDVDDVEMSDQLLGQGGFGVVKKGTYKGQSVAVKVLLNQFMTIHTKTEFEREVAVMSSLHHPNIIQFIGASNIEGKLALVTELAPLGNLAGVLAETLVPLSLKMTILLEVARAIHFLHSNNIIHRDIKPLNVLVFSLEHKGTSHVKLTDFGTSKFVSDTSATMTQNVGTTKYMAPETLGKSPHFDKAADIYSFAILSWEVVTNEHAYADSEFQWQSEIERFVLKGGRLSIPTDMNGKLALLIQQCWHQEPTRRPAISEIVQRLSELIYGEAHVLI